MKYALEIVTLGTYADPRRIVEVAQAAEASGWDGVFLWDHLAFTWGVPSAEPFIALAAVSQETRRIRLGIEVTPLPRRRPYRVAAEIAALDLLSHGRIIFGAGLGGVPREFAAFGEPTDARSRAIMLDEGLEVLDGLLRGQEVTHYGPFYTVEQVTLQPLPEQKPRPPIWIGGESPPALRRAARWDGWVLAGTNEHAQMVKSPAEILQLAHTIQKYRAQDTTFDIAMTGVSQPDDLETVQKYKQSGVTWWLESIFDMRGSFTEMLRRVHAGPPRERDE